MVTQTTLPCRLRRYGNCCLVVMAVTMMKNWTSANLASAFLRPSSIVRRCASTIFSCFPSASKDQEQHVVQHRAPKAETSTSTPLSPSMLPRPFFAIYYNDVYEVKLPPNHRFPMEKYRQVRERVQSGLWARQRNGTRTTNRVDCELRVSPLATVEELASTHSRDYIQRFLTGDQTEDEWRNVGFPWSEEGVRRACSSVGGTVAAAVAVLDEQHDHASWRKRRLCWGAHIAGGTHHAFYDRGEGFCVFSDIAVAANVVLQRFPETVRRILILDLDVHQGNGNAVLFQNRPEVFTFSLHCSSNYFSEKQVSDLDIELPADCNDETYLLTLRHWLKQIQQKAGTFDLVFFQAGVDILEHDRLGKMKITAQGIHRRNQLVFDFVARDLEQVPMVITMGGGYPQNKYEWDPILEAHANVYLQAYDYLAGYIAKEMI